MMKNVKCTFHQTDFLRLLLSETGWNQLTVEEEGGGGSQWVSLEICWRAEKPQERLPIIPLWSKPGFTALVAKIVFWFAFCFFSYLFIF